LSNGICDYQCNNTRCDFDEGDCEECASGCFIRWIGDKICDQACNNEDCQYDLGDCLECSPGCYYGWLGNGICDPLCMSSECNYDYRDCDTDDLCVSKTPNQTPGPIIRNGPIIDKVSPGNSVMIDDFVEKETIPPRDTAVRGDIPSPKV